MNRKLIRPNLSEIKANEPRRAAGASKSAAQPTSVPVAGTATGSPVTDPNMPLVPQGIGSPRRKIAPPESTSAEAFYYLKQMQSKTPMVIVLKDDERLRGTIEWYDKHCLKINRIKEPNLLVPKHAIKYMYKQEEEPRTRRSRNSKKEDGAAPDLEMDPYD